MQLTERELRVTYLVTKGMKNAEIAVEINITEHVVKNYLRIIYDKLGLDSRTQLAMWYIKHVENGGSNDS